MRRILLVVAVAVMMAAMVVTTAGAALADPVSGPSPGNPQSNNSANCIGIISSHFTANGLAPGGTLGEGNNLPGQTGPNHGARGDEIKALQAACNNANEK